MKSKHTPGPLEIHEGLDYIRVYARYNHSEEPLAVFTRKEDAKLYVAAPELLKAAKRAIMALAANGAPNCEAVKELRIAIEKIK